MYSTYNYMKRGAVFAASIGIVSGQFNCNYILSKLSLRD